MQHNDPTNHWIQWWRIMTPDMLQNCDLHAAEKHAIVSVLSSKGILPCVKTKQRYPSGDCLHLTLVVNGGDVLYLVP